MSSAGRKHTTPKKNLSEERLDLCLSAGNLAWWEMELPSGKVTFNENKITMLGYTQDDFQNPTYHSFMQLVHPDDYDRVMQAMQNHLDGKKHLYETDYRIKTKKGTYKWFHDRGSIIQKGTKDQPTIVKGVVFDITELKNAISDLNSHKKNLESLINKKTKELRTTNKELRNEISERSKAEEYMIRTKQHLKDIINSTSELIISFDMNNRITMWNRTAETITGYKTIEVINRSVDKIPLFINPNNIITLIRNACETTHPITEHIILQNKDQLKKIIQVTTSEIIGSNNDCQGALFVGQDITYDLELHGKLLYGNSYYLPDSTIQPALDLLYSFILQNHPCHIITRSTPAQIQTIIPNDPNITISLLSSSSLSNQHIVPDLTTLTNTITTFCKKNKEPIILLDGTHYLLTRFSFNTVLETFYTINEIIAQHQALLFLRIDPQTIEPQQRAIIENEFQPLPSRNIDDITIKDDTFLILKYIHEQNQLNAKVSYKKVTTKFNIAYVTAKNRLQTLIDTGLIITKREGKHRTIYVTEKAKQFLHKRTTN